MNIKETNSLRSFLNVYMFHMMNPEKDFSDFAFGFEAPSKESFFRRHLMGPE